MRDRLIELIKDCAKRPIMIDGLEYWADDIADYLIENDVVVMPKNNEWVIVKRMTVEEAIAEEEQNKLKPCPFCGSEIEIKGGPENWRPTWYDPDSGGDPYCINCKCGCRFNIGSQDAEDFINAWNRRTNDET